MKCFLVLKITLIIFFEFLRNYLKYFKIVFKLNFKFTIYISQLYLWWHFLIQTSAQLPIVKVTLIIQSKLRFNIFKFTLSLIFYFLKLISIIILKLSFITNRNIFNYISHFSCESSYLSYKILIILILFLVSCLFYFIWKLII